MSDQQLLTRRENNQSSNEGNNTAEGNEVKMQDLNIDDYEVDDPTIG